MKEETQRERERIKGLLKRNWNKTHPNYKSKFAFMIALIDERQKED